ncbi:MAG: HAD family hydrolase [Rhizobiaceae bacterium]
MPKPVLVFDLDGTLVDTAPDLLESLNHCLVHAGLEPARPQALRRYVGHGGRVMIERALEASGLKPTKSELDGLQDVFLRHYSDNIPGGSLPYAGALEAIDRFDAAGFGLAICTNKYQQLSEALIGGLGLAERFAAICGADRFAFRKPDPRHLTETIRVAGGDPHAAIMVGDSRTDIDTAIAAGIPVVAVDWGYTDEHVSAFRPTTVISHYDELTLDLARRLLEAERRA